MQSIAMGEGCLEDSLSVVLRAFLGSSDIRRRARLDADV